MKYKASIFDILQEFINAMTFPVNIYKVNSVPATAPRTGNDITLNVDDIYHAVIGATVIIGASPGAKPYTIVSWDESFAVQDEVMQLVVNDASGINPIVADSFNFYPPIFGHGTILEQGNQLTQQLSAWNKYPLIWAKEGVTETFLDDRGESHERESALTIYFLTDSNYDLDYGSIYNLYTRPMTRLKDNFVKVLNTESGNWPIGSTDREEMVFKTTEINKVGVIINSKNVTGKSLFGDNLSGVALEFTLKMFWPESNIFIG